MTGAQSDTGRGYAFAISAYLLWGGFPIYMSFLKHIPALEVVTHRVLWSVPVAGLVLILLGRTRDVAAALRSPRMLAMGALTGFFVSANWIIFVWAVFNDRVLDASLAYYISPLFSVLLGALVLGEKLSRVQIAAVGLAAIAVLFLALQAGAVPWAALGMMLSWGFYALCKRQLPIGPNQGFLLEVVVLTPIALSYAFWLAAQGEAVFLRETAATWLLIGSGAVTAIPLMLYANGAKGLRLSTIGILQYIAPTLIFFGAVFYFGEPFDTGRKIAFPMIWMAVAMFVWSSIRSKRQG